MTTTPLRRLLLVGALCASVGGLTACGGDEPSSDIAPKTVPALSSPTGDGLAAGAGDQASQVTDLPASTTTGPLPASGDDTSTGGDTSSDSSDATSSGDDGSGTSSDSGSSGTSGTTTGSGAAAGSGGTGGTSTPSGGAGTSTSGGGTSTSGGGGSGTSTSGGSSSSGGGASPSEFGEFCDTNPGVCR